MGHIFLEVTTSQGTLYGAWEQTTADGSPVEGAGGHDHGSHSTAAAGAPSPAVTKAEAEGHDHSDHSGHSHRRMLA